MTSPQKMVVTRSMAKQPPALVRHTAEEEEVFLGGACGETTWRRDVAMPVLKDAGVSFYNPQVEEWHEGLVELERRAKKSALVNLFVVSGATRGAATVVEAAHLISAGKRVVLVVEEVPEGAVVDGDILTASERKDLNRGRRYLLDVVHDRGEEGHTNADICANVGEASVRAAELVKNIRQAATEKAAATTLAAHYRGRLVRAEYKKLKRARSEPAPRSRTSTDSEASSGTPPRPPIPFIRRRSSLSSVCSISSLGSSGSWAGVCAY